MLQVTESDATRLTRLNVAQPTVKEIGVVVLTYFSKTFGTLAMSLTMTIQTTRKTTFTALDELGAPGKPELPSRCSPLTVRLLVFATWDAL